MPRPHNLPLKIAIIADGRSQEYIARKALIEPQRLSHAIYGRRDLDADAQARLAKVLRRKLAEIFPPLPPAPKPPPVPKPPSLETLP